MNGLSSAASQVGIPSATAIVFVPAHPKGRYPDGEIIFECRLSDAGQRILPVFTTLDRLVEALGEAQPWISLPFQSVRLIMSAVRGPNVAVDPYVGPGCWRWPDRLQPTDGGGPQ